MEKVDILKLTFLAESDKNRIKTLTNIIEKLCK